MKIEEKYLYLQKKNKKIIVVIKDERGKHIKVVAIVAKTYGYRA